MLVLCIENNKFEMAGLDPEIKPMSAVVPAMHIRMPRQGHGAVCT